MRCFGLTRPFVAGLLALSTLLPLGGCVIVVGDDDHWRSEWSDSDRRRPPRLGLETASVGPATASQLGLNRDRVTMIEEVRPGWPASESGLRKYDIITAINGDPDASPSRLRRAVRECEPGESLTLAILREGKPMEVTATPRAAPGGPPVDDR